MFNALQDNINPLRYTDELSVLLLTVANCCPVNNKIDESHWISFTTPPINGGQNLIRQLKIKDDQILDGKNRDPECRQIWNAVQIEFKLSLYQLKFPDDFSKWLNLNIFSWHFLFFPPSLRVDDYIALTSPPLQLNTVTNICCDDRAALMSEIY
jgi:hypothetical protein